MRREDITLAVSGTGWLDTDDGPLQPILSFRLDDTTGTLAERLRTEEGDPLDADKIDVTIRLHADLQDPEATGVVAVTNRITGEYVLECNAEADTFLGFVRAARRYGEATDGDTLYRVELHAGDDPDAGGTTVATYEKRTLLVYGDTGELLREHSLIPSGVEI